MTWCDRSGDSIGPGSGRSGALLGGVAVALDLDNGFGGECYNCNPFRPFVSGSLFAQGIGTGSAVPEPGTWALMLLGFFGIGGIRRRRARQNVSVSYT